MKFFDSDSMYDSDSLENSESSGDYIFTETPLRSGNDMNQTGNKTTDPDWANSDAVENNPAEDPDNSVSVIFGLVGGVVLLISIALLICIVWNRKRRHSANIPRQKNERRSVVSTDAELMLEGPIGFNQVVYGLDENLEESVIMSRASNPEHTNARGEAERGIVNNIYSSPTTDLEKHAYENQSPNACELTPDCDENAAKEDEPEESIDVDEYEPCAPALCNEKGKAVDKISHKHESKITNISTENSHKTSEIHKDGKQNDIGETQARTGATEIHMFDDEELLSMPPPSPCISHANMDYMNVPKYAKPSNSETKIHETCHGYVNLSDDMKLSTKEISKRQHASRSENKNKKSFSYDPNLNDHELAVDNLDLRYVNSPENLGRPPRYDETSFKMRQAECDGSEVGDTQSKPYYVNITEKNNKCQDGSTINNDFEKSDGEKRIDENLETETDLYLSMTSPSVEDSYVPVEHPDNLTSYERKTLQMHSIKNCTDDDVFSDDYSDTQQTLRLFHKASSCDSVYSYADPQLVCNLYRGRDRVTNVPYSKPRSANRSKTFGAADSKDRSYKMVKFQKQSVGNETMVHNMGDRKITRDSNNDSKAYESLNNGVIADYVNTGRAVLDSSTGHSKISKIPVFTRRKSSGEIKEKIQTSKHKSNTHSSSIPVAIKRKVSVEKLPELKENDSKSKFGASDGIEHDYENEMPKRCMKPPTARKLKAPVILPKPKLISKTQSQTSTNGL